MNQRVKLTKMLLRQAMLQRLQQTTIDRVTVVALCEDAGINRTTFYRYYNAPADVVQEIEQNVLSDVQEIMDRIDPDSDVSYLRRMDEVYLYLYNKRRIIRLLMTNMDFGLHLLQSTMQTTGIMQRQAKRMDETDRKLTASFLLHGGYSVIRDWLMEEEPIPPAEFSRRIRNILRYISL